MATDRIVGGRFRIVRELGRGGMGTVHEAVNLATGRAVALKIPHPELAAEPRFLRRFQREVRAASKLRHPHVIDVLDVVEDEHGLPVAVMELLTGAALSRVLATRGRLALDQTSSIAVPILRALHDLHDAGVVHRDLKPENVFVARLADGSVSPKLLDFGIARVLEPLGQDADASATQTGSMVGSPYYMAPEQVSGMRDVDRRADVWAAGVLVYECVTGERPFGGDNFGQIFAAILQGTREPVTSRVSSLPEPVVAAIEGALARDRDARAPTLTALIDALAPHAGAPITLRAEELEIDEAAPTQRYASAGRPTAARRRAEIESAPTLDSGRSELEREATVEPAARPPASRRGRVIAVAAAAIVALAGAGLVPYLTSAEPEPIELLEAAEAARWDAGGETLAREALARAPGSRRARYVLASHLTNKARLASSGRMAALREARSLVRDLVEEDPGDTRARTLLVIAHYLLLERAETLEALAGLPEAKRAEYRGRIAWWLGARELARGEIARCLELADPPVAQCAYLHSRDVELAEGLRGLEAFTADPIERAVPAVARVRMRLLLGRTAEAALVAETGFARGELDDLDRPYVEGMLAAAQGDRDGARAHLASLEALIGDRDILPAVRLNGTVQTAELAAAIGDAAAVARSARAGLRLGAWNVEHWERTIELAPYAARLRPILDAMRARAAEERTRLGL